MVEQADAVVKPKVASYGSWKSPLTPEMIARENVLLYSLMLDGEDAYWVEQRSAESGREVIVKHAADGNITDVTPKPFNASTTVHEYGGGAYVVSRGTVYFSNLQDQRLYRQEPGDAPKPITALSSMRYADAVVDIGRRHLVCVREDHANSSSPTNTLVSVDLSGTGSEQVLASGNDFYSSPRLNPDGSRLAWLTWNHPNMPWDGTELYVGELNKDGSLGRTTRIAGDKDESVFQPEWSPDSVLHFISDRTGWWNIYRCLDDHIEPLCLMEAEFGLPQWLFRMSTYNFASSERIICAYIKRGNSYLASLNTKTLELSPIDTPYSFILEVKASGCHVLLRCSSPTEPTSISHLDLASDKFDVLRKGSTGTIDRAYLSTPEEIEFPTDSGLTAFGFFYPPHNGDYSPIPGERPPLIVICHGGPTSFSPKRLDLEILYWTSRGFAVLDVNYGGSSCYGRAYRKRLEGSVGVVDVNDCANGACHMVRTGRVDGGRLIIRGRSAGGYVTLAALTFHNLFKAGASYCGLGDLEAFAKKGHKFESHYYEGLVGPYPERRDLYVERSPIHFVDRISCPVIMFHGLNDPVVPHSQTDIMYEALRKKGLPVSYLAFEGEDHYLLKGDTIKRSLEAELYFYSKIFRFELPEAIEPVPIANM